MTHTFSVKKVALFLFTAMLFAFATPSLQAQADDVYTIIVKKQEEKKKTQWSLSEWIDTRDRIRLMDLWLALHSPSPYEFYLGGAYVMTNPNATAHVQGGKYHAAAYASIFGLAGELDSTTPNRRTETALHLRIFGYHSQGTNITLHAGIRSENPDRNAFLGGGFTLGLSPFFGIDTVYHHHYNSVLNAPASSGATGAQGAWNEFRVGAYIDFGVVRIFGNYFKESDTALARTGTEAGLRFFF